MGLFGSEPEPDTQPVTIYIHEPPSPYSDRAVLLAAMAYNMITTHPKRTHIELLRALASGCTKLSVVLVRDPDIYPGDEWNVLLKEGTRTLYTGEFPALNNTMLQHDMHEALIQLDQKIEVVKGC